VVGLREREEIGIGNNRIIMRCRRSAGLRQSVRVRFGSTVR
jgi:hypothetical protein